MVQLKVLLSVVQIKCDREFVLQTAFDRNGTSFNLWNGSIIEANFNLVKHFYA